MALLKVRVYSDEVDMLLHPLKSELNWPLGGEEPLDMTTTPGLSDKYDRCPLAPALVPHRRVPAGSARRRALSTLMTTTLARGAVYKLRSRRARRPRPSADASFSSG